MEDGLGDGGDWDVDVVNMEDSLEFVEDGRQLVGRRR